MSEFLSAIRSRAAFILVAGVIAIWTLHAPVYPPGAGSDASWQIGLIVAAQRHFQFGQKFIFPYGPLGFLDTYNRYVDHVLWVCSLIFSYVLHFAFVYVVFVFVQKVRPKLSFRPLATILFILAMLSVIPIVPNDDKLLLVAIIFLYFADSQDEVFQSYFLISIAGLMLALVSLIKFSSTVMAIATLFAFMSLQICRGRWRRSLFLAVCSIFTFLAGWVLVGQQLTNLMSVFRYEVQIISGYSAAMSFAGPLYETAVGFLGIISGTVLLVYCLAVHRGRLLAFLVLSWAFYILLFKLGFTRAGGHSWIYFSTATVYWFLILSIVIEENIRFRRAILTGIIILISLNCILQNQRYKRHAGINVPPGVWAYRSSFADAYRLITDKSFRSYYLAAGKDAILESYRLKHGEIAKFVGSESVDVFPTEIGIVWAEGLNWSPRPAFLSYLTYTPDLDSLNAGYFLKHEAPEWVLWRWREYSIDGRYSLFDGPETFRTLLCNYESQARLGDLVILKHKENSCGEPVEIKTVSGKFNDPIEIPGSDDGYLFARVQIHETLISRLKGLILRSNAPRIVFPEKSVTRYRLIWRVAPDGLYVGELPGSSNDFADLFSGTIRRNISFFLLEQPEAHQDLTRWINDYLPDVQVDYFLLRSPLRVLSNADKVQDQPKWGSFHKLSGGRGGIDFSSNPLLLPTGSLQWALKEHAAQYIRIQGWSTGEQYSANTHSIYLVFEKGTNTIALLAHRMPRPDVSKTLKIPEDKVAGFEATLWRGDFTEGCYRVSVMLVSPANKTLYQQYCGSLCFPK